SMQLSVFHTQIRDLIVRETDIKTNLNDGHVNGSELALTYRFTPSWSIFGNISWVDTEIKNHRNQNIANELITDQLSKVPPINGMAGLRWDANEKFWSEVYVSFADRQDDLSQADREDDQRIPEDGTPGYVTYNLRFGYKLSERADLSVALENLSNEDYRIHGSGQNAAGRSIIATVHYSF
ncbi:MAG: TonB-dependent receptor, partial [Lentisphaeraceae bacterium]|nr:TonB-dependent receptor [Lentisphaeraceae bacterium]